MKVQAAIAIQHAFRAFYLRKMISKRVMIRKELAISTSAATLVQVQQQTEDAAFHSLQEKPRGEELQLTPPRRLQANNKGSTTPPPPTTHQEDIYFTPCSSIKDLPLSARPTPSSARASPLRPSAPISPSLLRSASSSSSALRHSPLFRALHQRHHRPSCSSALSRFSPTILRAASLTSCDNSILEHDICAINVDPLSSPSIALPSCILKESPCVYQTISSPSLTVFTSALAAALPSADVFRPAYVLPFASTHVLSYRTPGVVRPKPEGNDSFVYLL